VPIAFIIIGVVIAVAAWRNTYRDLGTLLAGDFTGTNSFLVWLGALGIIGAFGYVKGLEQPSRAMIALIIIAIMISNRGFWPNLQSALSGATPSATPIAPEPKAPGNPTIKIDGGSGGSGTGISGAVTTILPLLGI
jgi:hypothetical protein